MFVIATYATINDCSKPTNQPFKIPPKNVVATYPILRHMLSYIDD